jgi:hypothetical protein
VLDALACLWTARWIAQGVSEAFGDGTLDARGRPMVIRA